MCADTETVAGSLENFHFLPSHIYFNSELIIKVFLF